MKLIIFFLDFRHLKMVTIRHTETSITKSDYAVRNIKQ